MKDLIAIMRIDSTRSAGRMWQPEKKIMVLVLGPNNLEDRESYAFTWPLWLLHGGRLSSQNQQKLLQQNDASPKRVIVILIFQLMNYLYIVWLYIFPTSENPLHRMRPGLM